MQAYLVLLKKDLKICSSTEKQNQQQKLGPMQTENGSEQSQVYAPLP